MTFPAQTCSRSVFASLLIALMSMLGCEHSQPKKDPRANAEKPLPSPDELCRLVFRRAMNLPLDQNLAAFADAGAARKSELPAALNAEEQNVTYRTLARCAVTLSDCETLPASLSPQYDQALRAIRQGDPQADDTCDPLIYRRAQQNQSLADYDILLEKNADCDRCFFEKSVLRSQQNDTLSDADLVRALAHQKHPALLREHAVRRARANDPLSATLYEEYLTILTSDDDRERERTHRALAALYQNKDAGKYRAHLDAASALTLSLELLRAQLSAAETDDDRFIFLQRLTTFDDASAKERATFADLAFSEGDHQSAIAELDRALSQSDITEDEHQAFTKKRAHYIAQTPGVRERPYQGSVTAIAKALRGDIEPLVLALPPKGNQLTRARIDVVLDLDASGTLTALDLVKDTLGEESIARAIRINLRRAQIRSPGGTHRFALEFTYGKP